MTEKSKAVLPDIASKKDDTVTIKRGVSPNQSLIQPSYVKEQDSIDINLTSLKPLNYKNGRKIEPSMFNYANYYSHREQLPRHYHPLVQYLESTELKYHNDNLFENSPTGFPTRAQLLKEKVKHLPIVNSTAADKARYKRKLEENQKNILMLRKKYEFKTYDDHSSHYFLTGARFNRHDVTDAKILNKYGIFVHRTNPDLVYIKSNKRALMSLDEDMARMKNFLAQPKKTFNESKMVQVSEDLLN